MLNDGYDKALPSLLTLSTTGLKGHKYKLYIERWNKPVRKHNFTHRVAKIWNSLPSSVVEADDIKAFERELDNHWKDQDLVTNFKAEITISSDNTYAW